MLLSQIITPKGARHVVAREGTEAFTVNGVENVYDLALRCADAGTSLVACIEELGFGRSVDLAGALQEGRVLPPITHPDPAHLHLTGTGLTHLGSASTRDAMHQSPAEDTALTDSMKMFNMGLEGGKPANGAAGAQPEWFYKGTGMAVVPPEGALISPDFADDGGEEPEIAGIYVIGAEGTPFRVGFALSNEFSDHVMEQVNYLYLAHSKLRPASFGPEILVGDLPEDIRGTSRIRRGDKTIFEGAFLSGAANMSHSIANLEHHHFKYGIFRQPGDVHVHMFGTATLSFAEGVRTEPGDIFEIEAPGFGLPLRNTLTSAAPAPAPSQMLRVHPL
ncbi:GguC protein [Rhodophyticola sp. CCM32]|uniref:AraD1 family protein n=1 Tax=Rhodophyticola sp. CCM32 TaxID=2916397 RepID=UPI00107F2362|nr:AraD1 family protein [Rhodophyticola sp. CCM32]QBX99895.1 GguC protein [Rhodophyticola sp. CCM32]